MIRYPIHPLDAPKLLPYAPFIMLRAAFPGSFDPPTFGHLNIIERAVDIFDELHIVVAVNREKKYLFSPDERVAMMKDLVSHWSNVRVDMWDSLIVNYLSKKQIKVLIRGVRGVSDFSYEFDLSMMNKGLNPSIETIFMTTDPKYFVLRSSAIKELASFGGDVSKMVPPIVAEALKKKYDRGSF
ncbi:Phosphopantetheine adenylyltransferase [Gracilinema caldarium DSM 7334]|uniref:Phosphopantetheine adenylyltransferase n=2 Tax=Gracilinema caldarium TaxID=215591 RepID=F8F3H7_GRAC1|nr:Phosphopantetheine adenylyltransferase [Gracilinema caldarium DSM 7334]